jgi:hypothetical protein
MEMSTLSKFVATKWVGHEDTVSLIVHVICSTYENIYHSTMFCSKNNDKTEIDVPEFIEMILKCCYKAGEPTISQIDLRKPFPSTKSEEKLFKSICDEIQRCRTNKMERQTEYQRKNFNLEEMVSSGIVKIEDYGNDE